MKISNKALLVTSSILDSYSWYKECPSSWKDKAATDLSNSLNRVYTDLGPAIKRGMDFEAKLCKDLALPRTIFESRHGEVLAIFHDKCAYGLQQEVTKREIVLEDQRFMLYGKMDVFYPKGFRKEHIGTSGNAVATSAYPNGKILDIKTTAKWKGHGYYTGRAQHPLYIASSGITDFEYVVAVGEDKEIGQDKAGAPIMAFIPDSVICVDAALDVATAEEILFGKIRDFMAFLANNPKLQDAYCNTFTRF